VEGASRFLNRVWRFVVSHIHEIGRGGDSPRVMRGAIGGASPPPDFSDAGRAFRRTIHETIARVTDDLDHDFHFNTAVSAIMELTNALYAFQTSATPEWGVAPAEREALMREAVETLILLLGPFCPHITEELWSQLGHHESVFRRAWPVADLAALVKQAVTVVVQVDGKVRGRVVVEMNAGEEAVQEQALADEKVRPWLRGRRVERVVVVPNRLVNVVTRA